MGTGGKVAVAALAVVAAVVLFFVLREGDEGSQPTSSTAAAVAEQVPAGGPSSAGSKPGEPKSTKPEQPRPTTIVVEGGQPVGGVQELTFQMGDDIRFRVVSDIADHAHLHGYDVMEDVGPGIEADFDVPATIDGVFEVELEESVVPIAEITVEPS